MPHCDDSHGVHLEDMDLQPLLGLLSILRKPATELPQLIQDAHANSDVANMCMQMFYVLMALGQHAFAVDMQFRALQARCLYRIHGPATPTIRLLAIMGPGDMMDNTPIEFLLENSDIRLDILYLLPDKALARSIPDHDVAIVAIGESDNNAPLLERLTAVLELWPRPVLNLPQNVMRCARDAAYQLLHDIPHVLMPRTHRWERWQVHPTRFPFTIRPVDTHAGMGLEKFESEAGLADYFERFPGTAYFVSDYMDYQSDDGFFRKLRIAMIDGCPYVCHVALSDHWMVHYLTAHMERSEWKRAQESAWMADFDHSFAVRHGAALKAISDRLGLDYMVLDCAEMRDGRLLLFEVDSRAFIHATDPVDIFPYKHAVMQKAFDAFRAMLLDRLAAHSAPR